MAVYKVPQDVEAEDKLIGPFTFRQFVFLLIMVAFLYLGYLLLNINFALVIIPIPFVTFFAALAFPWRKDQPTEVYLTALIHFWTQPRKRVWDQEGHVEHVNITVPKKIEHKYTDGLSNNEVRSRLHNLASTLDTRGWASKNVDVPAAGQQPGGTGVTNVTPSDRLVMPRVAEPVMPPGMSVGPKDDVMDFNNPVAQNFNNLVNQASESHRAQVVERMKQANSDDDSSNGPAYNPYPDMQQSVVNPNGPQTQQPQAQQIQPRAPEAQGAIINLANNSDLNVSTIARQAEQAMQNGDTIELH